MMKRGRLLITTATSIIVTGLFIVSFMSFYYRADYVTGSIISEEVKRLATIFNKINRECTILGFDNQQNPINFLNVGSFEGSEVGPMNLKFPEKWAGPYVKDNPTMQGKEFMVVKTDYGYFVTPGNGVKLPSGKVIGKNILLSFDVDIDSLVNNKGALVFKGKALAKKLEM